MINALCIEKIPTRITKKNFLQFYLLYRFKIKLQDHINNIKFLKVKCFFMLILLRKDFSISRDLSED